MSRSLIRGVLVAWLLVLGLGACGLATSNEDRIARAQTHIADGEYRAASIELKNALSSNGNNATARLLLAKVSLGLGDIESADKELQRAAELNAPESDLQSLHADILLASRRHTDLLAFLGEEPAGLTSEQLWYYRGEALLGLGRNEVARQTYEEWLGQDSASTEARLGLATATLQGGELDDALQQLTDLAGSAPSDYRVLQTLGAAHYRAGDFAAAEKALLGAEQHIRPQADLVRYVGILGSLVEIRLALEKLDDAHLSLDRLSGISPDGPATLFLAARLARVEGDYAGAARHLQKLLNIVPDNVQAQLFLANVQMMQRNFAQAERLLHRVVAMSPDNIQARKLLARVQLQQAQPAGAAEALAPVLAQEEDDPDIFAILAEASMQQGDVDSAIRQFRAAVELAPDDMSAKLNLAEAYIAADQAELALEMLALVPESGDARLRRDRLMMIALLAAGRQDEADRIAENLTVGDGGSEADAVTAAEFYLQTKRGVRAAEILRSAIDRDEGATTARNLLAHIEISSGNVDVAHRLFDEVLANDKTNQNALIGLARLAEMSGDSEEVVRLLTRAVDAHPGAIGPRVLLAGKLLRDGDAQSAETLANELVSIGFVNAHVGEVVAGIYEQVGRSDDALFHYQQAARLAPGDASVQFGMARSYLMLDRSVDARQALRRALEIQPDWVPAMALMVLVDFRQGRLEEAATVIEQFRKQYPGNPVGMVLEGELHVRQENYLAAAESFGRASANGAGRSAVLRQYRALADALEPNPEQVLQEWLSGNAEDVTVRRQLAQHFLVSGEGQRAVSEYERLLAANPQDTLALNNLAWQYQQDGELERARELAEQARAISPTSGSIADTLGWIHYALGDLQQSRELLSDAARLSPDNGEIQFHFAVVLAESGDREQARRILERLRDNKVQFPSLAEAEALLGRLE